MGANHNGVGRSKHKTHAPAIADDAGSHADRETVCTDSGPLCGQEMSELVDEDQEAKAEEDEKESWNRTHVDQPFRLQQFECSSK